MFKTAAIRFVFSDVRTRILMECRFFGKNNAAVI